MISIITPTRHRQPILERMMDSALATASSKDLEFIVHIDEKLDEQTTFLGGARANVFTNYAPEAIPRPIFSELWNGAAKMAQGDILMLANDDIVFHTEFWDEMVEEQFDRCPDKILMVHGDDMHCHRKAFGPHPFVSRKWVECLGYLSPPYFTCDFNDTWINDVANALGRRKFIPAQIEHCHPNFGEAQQDSTYREANRRREHDGNHEKYFGPEMQHLRLEDRNKLVKLMDLSWKVRP